MYIFHIPYKCISLKLLVHGYVTCKQNSTYKKNYMYFFCKIFAQFFENHRIFF